MLSLRVDQACWVLSAGAHVGVLIIGNALLGAAPSGGVAAVGPTGLPGAPARPGAVLEQIVSLAPPEAPTPTTVPAPAPAQAPAPAPAPGIPAGHPGAGYAHRHLRPMAALSRQLSTQPTDGQAALPLAQPVPPESGTPLALARPAAAQSPTAAAQDAGSLPALPGSVGAANAVGPLPVASPAASPAAPSGGPTTVVAASPDAASSAAHLRPGDLSAAAPAAPSEPSVLPVRYLRLAMPAYPPAARRLAAEGLVVVRVRVEHDGQPGAWRVLQGSGVAELDAAALAAVREWRFLPAQRAGHAVAASIDVPVRFSLQMAATTPP